MIYQIIQLVEEKYLSRNISLVPVIIVLLSFLNVFIFFFVMGILGGDADMIKDGEYFLGSHGSLIKTYWFIYAYSDIHGFTVDVSLSWIIPVMMPFAAAKILYSIDDKHFPGRKS